MKKARLIAAVLAVLMLTAVLSGCSGRSWEDISDDEIVAKVGDREMSKFLVRYYSVEQSSSYAMVISQMGGQIDEDEIPDMDESLSQIAGFAVLAEYAKQQGIDKSLEDSEEAVYQEYVVDAKKTGYEYMTPFINTIKSTLRISTDEMIEIAAQLEQIRASAYNVMEEIYNELKDTYSDDDEMIEQMQAEASKLIEGIAGEQYMPRSGNMTFDISTAVTQSYYMLENS